MGLVTLALIAAGAVLLVYMQFFAPAQTVEVDEGQVLVSKVPHAQKTRSGWADGEPVEIKTETWRVSMQSKVEVSFASATYLYEIDAPNGTKKCYYDDALLEVKVSGGAVSVYLLHIRYEGAEARVTGERFLVYRGPGSNATVLYLHSAVDYAKGTDENRTINEMVEKLNSRNEISMAIGASIAAAGIAALVILVVVRRKRSREDIEIRPVLVDIGDGDLICHYEVVKDGVKFYCLTRGKSLALLGSSQDAPLLRHALRKARGKGENEMHLKRGEITGIERTGDGLRVLIPGGEAKIRPMDESRGDDIEVIYRHLSP